MIFWQINRMNTYLFTTLPTNDLGLLTRSLPIARELRNRGHKIVFCSPAKAPDKLISEAGFKNLYPAQHLYYLISGDIRLKRIFQLLRSPHPIRDMGIIFSIIRHMSQATTAEVWNIDHFMSLFGMWNEKFVRVSVEVFMNILDIYDPDVIVDFWNPFACIAAKARKKLLITIIQADMHPQSKGFIWWKKTPPEFQHFTVSGINKILAEYGLPQIQTIGDLFIGDETLVLGMPETDPLPDPVHVTYLGPILWQKQGEKLPDWIKDLSKEQPVIWLYPGNLKYMRAFSTSFDSAVVLRACIEALKNEAVQVVLTTGHHSLPADFTSLPPNFRHEPYIPGLAMAERSDLLIHHGGYGSCQIGLYAGKPALIIPTYSERESNARRVALLGAGDFVLPKSDKYGLNKQVSAEEIRTKVFKILSDVLFRENAKRISDKMKTYGGASDAARLIESVIVHHEKKVG
jgi:UDP:flavonoid glycosyltransferase YjiC (YdhE family)